MMAFPVLDRKEKRIQARERGRKGRAKPDCKGAVKQTNQHPEKRLFAPSLGREGRAEKGSSGLDSRLSILHAIPLSSLDECVPRSGQIALLEQGADLLLTVGGLTEAAEFGEELDGSGKGVYGVGDGG
jgi:hypothetical protein